MLMKMKTYSVVSFNFSLLMAYYYKHDLLCLYRFLHVYKCGLVYYFADVRNFRFD